MRYRDEKGSILLYTLLLMAVLMVIGLAAGTGSELELKIAGSDKAYRRAFAAAEAGIDYVLRSRPLYNSSNIDPTTPLSDQQVLNPHQDYAVQVTYQGSRNPPRGSGFSNPFRAHHYLLVSNGNSSSQAAVEIRADGYRIGY